MIYKFEDYSLDAERQELRHGSQLVAVEPQVLDLLHYLIRNRAHVVSKDDLISSIWKGRIVSDSTLTSRIAAARHAIGDNGDGQRLIRTIARKGIRFVGEVSESTTQAQPASPQDAESKETSAAIRGRDKPSIAVLPFTNMSGDPEQEYFSDGITEDIITALSRLHWFFVIARNSTFVFKGQAINVKQIGRDLGVDYVLEGSIRKSGQLVRITAQLLDAVTGTHIWSERYDRELTDIFSLQDEITTSVTAAIEPKLVAAEGLRAQTRPNGDLDAWDLVARALWHFWKFNAASAAAGIGILKEAVRRYPDYAPAHSMLGFALLMSDYVGWNRSGSEGELAAQAAYRALELDDSDPWAHLTVGYVALTNHRRDEAVRHFETALELNPNFAAAVCFIGFAHALDGQSEPAIRQMEYASRMSPRDPLIGLFFAPTGSAHYMAGRYGEAIKWSRQAVHSRPGYLGGHRILCASLAQAGQIEEARAAMERLRQLQPNLSVAWIKQFVPYSEKPMAKFLDGLRKAGLPD